MARAMADLGIEVLAGHAEDLSETWLLENQGSIDVLHLHWPHFMYNAPDLAGRVSRCANLISYLARARSLGYKVVWTMHNLYPHESPSPDLDRLARLAITRLTTAIIVHCQYARELLRQHFFRDEGVFIVPHGHFIDPYPNTLTRSESRKQLGLAENKFVYLFFGNVRPNKGLETLLQAFANILDDDVILLCAAKVYSDYGVSLVERAVKFDSRIVVHASQFFANEEFQLYFNAADVVVLPFLDILTSGSAITALSFGRPTIVPAIGCLTELIDDNLGEIYDPKQSGALEQAMRAVRQRDLEACRVAINHRLKSLSWDSIARMTLQVYRY